MFPVALCLLAWWLWAARGSLVWLPVNQWQQVWGWARLPVSGETDRRQHLPPATCLPESEGAVLRPEREKQSQAGASAGSEQRGHFTSEMSPSFPPQFPSPQRRGLGSKVWGHRAHRTKAWLPSTFVLTWQGQVLGHPPLSGVHCCWRHRPE